MEMESYALYPFPVNLKIFFFSQLNIGVKHDFLLLFIDEYPTVILSFTFLVF